jgi:phenylacetate-CoA ligase
MSLWSRIQPPLTRNILLPLWARLTGSNYLAYIHRIENEQWDGAEQIQARQNAALRRLITYAYERVPYYRKAWAEIGFSPATFSGAQDLVHLPVLTKDIIRTHAAELCAEDFPTKDLVHNATGGSTGVPVRFYVTKQREVFHAATVALNYEWAGLPLGGRLAMLWGSAFEATKYTSIKGRLENMLLGRLFLQTFSLDENILAAHAQALIKFKPRLLLGYTSSLRHLAEYLERHPIHLPSLTAVMSGAETLYDHDRDYFERIFRVPVFNRYGGRDSGTVAAECGQHSMHINSNIVAAEIGAEGHILVTDLWNYGMPLIRYDTEDIGRLASTACACGRKLPILAAIEGRVLDLLHTPDGRRVPGEFFPHLMKDVTWVRQFQVIQHQRDALSITIVRDEATFDEAGVAYLKKYIKQYFGHVHISIQYVKHIPTPPSGKHRFTISAIGQEQS